MPAVVAAIVSASLFVFNRDADWDVWAPYFFGSYGLGALAWWASDPKRRPMAILALLLLIVVPTQLALAADFRSRIALAFTVACLLLLFANLRQPSRSALTTCSPAPTSPASPRAARSSPAPTPSATTGPSRQRSIWDSSL